MRQRSTQEQWDEVLVARIHGGDRGAEEELFGKYLLRVKRKICSSLGGENQDAEDLISTVLQAVLVNIRRGQYRGDSSLGRYIYQITDHKIADYFRQKPPSYEEIRDNHLVSHPTQEVDMEQDETMEKVKVAMDRLKLQHRQVIYWHYYQGLSVAEVGKKFHLSPRKVSRIKNYALKRLRKIMGVI